MTRTAESEFRSLMSTFPTGVAVVTAADTDGTRWGMTCSSVCSVTLSPPTLLVCLRDTSPTLAAVLRTGCFALNLLPARARAVAELFSSGAADRFDRIASRTPHGAAGPHLADAHAIADCVLAGTQDVGDHVVVFGKVTGVTMAGEAGQRPLLYGLRRYAGWPEQA